MPLKRFNMSLGVFYLQGFMVKVIVGGGGGFYYSFSTFLRRYPAVLLRDLVRTKFIGR